MSWRNSILADFGINWSIKSKRVSVFRKKDKNIKNGSSRAKPTQTVLIFVCSLKENAMTPTL
jgi:hypothetical protein